MSDIISKYGSLENARKNLELKHFAQEVLSEENYVRFMQSYRFMFWFQVLGILAGLLIPTIGILVITKNTQYALFGLVFGLFWMIFWLIISLFVPQGKIYRKFDKWYRRETATLDELDEIFKN